MSDDEERAKAPEDTEEAQSAGGAQDPGEAAGEEHDPDSDAAPSAGTEGSGPATASAAPASHAEFEDALRGVIAELPPEKRNKWIPGTLRVHYRGRDVDFAMDGESGLRLLAVLAGTTNDLDSIRRSSDAQRIWVMVDRSEVLGAQWIPDELLVPVAVTMDPGGLVDAAR